MLTRQTLKFSEFGFRHWRLKSSMAAFSSSSSSSSLLSCKSSNQSNSNLRSRPFLRNPNPNLISSTSLNSFGCRCSDNGDNHKISSKNLQKARAVPPSLPQLLCREAKSENNVVRNGDNNRGSVNSIEFPNQPGKIVVAVDVDEVLGSFLSALNRFIEDRYSFRHSISEYHVYEFFKIWKCSRDEADIRVHEFFKTTYFTKGIHPIPGARQTLQNLSRFCNLSVVTSRQNAIKDHTIEWIENHYPGLFHEIHFGNHFALEGLSRPKADICRSLGAHVLIDDNPRYAIECAEAGIRVLLFDYENSYPWSKTESVTKNPLITRVHNWSEVEDRLVSRTFS